MPLRGDILAVQSGDHIYTAALATGTAAGIVGLTLLLVGVTVAARLPRLVKPHWGTYLSAAVAFAAGAAAYWLVPDNVRTWLGGALTAMPSNCFAMWA